MPETRDELIERITKEVLAVLASQEADTSRKIQDEACILVLGDSARIPAYIQEGCRLADVNEYARDGDVMKYRKVCITSLNFTELCDIALCRDTRPLQCAVINALLRGKEVILLESGLPHRAFAATAGRSVYTVLEGYLRTILSFGVKLAGDSAPVKQVEKVTASGYMANMRGSGRPNAARLVNESMALDMIRAGGAVRLLQNAILTPSARDVFNRAKAEIIYDA
jgi:ethanolamine utilization protein